MGIVRLIGVPMDLGANRRGVDMGPSALRYAGIHRILERLGFTVSDAGNLPVSGPEEQGAGSDRARYLPEIARTCGRLAREVARAREAGQLPLVMGGDHSIAVGTLGGLAQADSKAGVLWIDAHADINTPDTSPSGNVHGMPIAASVGLGPAELLEHLPVRRPPLVPPERFVLLGVRDVDPPEREFIKALGIRVYTMADVDRRGIAPIVGEALQYLLRGADALHVSLDVDALDPQVAPGVGTPKAGGLTYREGHLIMEMVAETGRLRSLEVVEVNPILDTSNRTAQVAAELVGSAFGQSVI